MFLREPCVGTREGVGEASVAARVGGAMEHRNLRERKRRGRGRGRRQHRLDREGEGQSGTSVSRNQARTYVWCRDLGGLALPRRKPGPCGKGESRNP